MKRIHIFERGKLEQQSEALEMALNKIMAMMKNAKKSTAGKPDGGGDQDEGDDEEDEQDQSSLSDWKAREQIEMFGDGSVGRSKKTGRWWGWSHRARSDFPTKEAAKKFAESVS